MLPHLFRTEYQKLVAVLVRRFGLAQMELAEDIAAETFLAALESWPYKGVPENPVAWLYTVAKNKAKNYLARQSMFNKKIVRELQSQVVTEMNVDLDLSEQNITDSQLQMIFAVCNPAIPMESQVALALRVLCGFGIEEIAHAFLTNKETINKRLHRAKEKIRSENITLEFPAEAEVPARIESVLTTLYLLFSEGYYSESNDLVLREDLCQEAMRLVQMLIEYPPANLPATNALMALMCFHASRFAARKDVNGELILYADQDEILWNYELISRGAAYLRHASTGGQLSRYHLEAGIAYWHTIKTDSVEKWENILQLYNHLLQISYSPIAALNRTYALWKANGREEAINAAESLGLENNPYYHVLLGELYNETDPEKSKHHFTRALQLAGTQADKKQLEKKLRGRK